MKNIIKLTLMLGLIIISSSAFGQKKVMRTQKVKVGKILLEHYKKNKTFKISGSYILAPKGSKFVSYKGKTLLMSEKIDSKISNREYMTYFEQFTWDVNGPSVEQIIGTCSCGGQQTETTGDNCRFTAVNGEIRCTGGCTEGNEGRECQFTVTQVIQNEALTTQMN